MGISHIKYPSQRDTIKLGNDIGTKSNPLTTLSRITIPTGVTFDGNSKKIHIAIPDFEGTINLTGGTIKNLSLISDNDISNNVNTTGYITNTGAYGFIYDCYTNANTYGVCTGCIVGTVGGDLTISGCVSSGDIIGALSGGIVGYIEYESNLTIDKCYATGNLYGGSGIGGIIGTIVFSTSITINDCYYVGTNADILRNGGIANLYWDNSAWTSHSTVVSINRCYSIGKNATIIGSETEANVDYALVNYCVAETIVNTGTLKPGSTGNSTTLSDIEGKLYEPSGDASGNWDSDIWTVGNGTNYPILNRFTTSPWNNYFYYKNIATFSKPVNPIKLTGNFAGKSYPEHTAFIVSVMKKIKNGTIFD